MDRRPLRRLHPPQRPADPPRRTRRRQRHRQRPGRMASGPYVKDFVATPPTGCERTSGRPSPPPSAQASIPSTSVPTARLAPCRGRPCPAPSPASPAGGLRLRRRTAWTVPPRAVEPAGRRRTRGPDVLLVVGGVRYDRDDKIGKPWPNLPATDKERISVVALAGKLAQSSVDRRTLRRRRRPSSASVGGSTEGAVGASRHARLLRRPRQQGTRTPVPARRLPIRRPRHASGAGRRRAIR